MPKCPLFVLAKLVWQLLHWSNLNCLIKWYSDYSENWICTTWFFFFQWIEAFSFDSQDEQRTFQENASSCVLHACLHMCSLYFWDRWSSQGKSINSSSFDFKANRVVLYVLFEFVTTRHIHAHAHTPNVTLTPSQYVWICLCVFFFFHTHSLSISVCLPVCLYSP